MKISLDEWQEYLGVLAVELVRCAHCSDTVWLSNPNCVDLKKSRSSTSTQSEKTVQGFVASPVFLFVGTISDWNMWKELCYFFWDMYPKSGYCHLFPRKKTFVTKISQRCGSRYLSICSKNPEIILKSTIQNGPTLDSEF